MLLVQRHYVVQGPDPGDPLPRRRPRRLREDVRARQGGAAQPRRADRGGQHRRATSTTSPATGSARRVRAAGHRADRRRGRGGRPGHPGLGARPAGRGDHGGGPQAERARRLPVDVSRARHRRAPAQRRGAVLRRVLGRHPGAARRSSSTTSARAPRAATRHLQPWGVVRFSGRWYVVGLDTDRGEERVFRLSRVVGRGPPGRRARRRTTSRPAPTSARRPGGSRRRPVTARRRVLVRTGPRPRLRRGRRAVEPDVAGPDSESPWDRLVLRRRTGSPRRCSATAPTSYVEAPAELRDDVVARPAAAVRLHDAPTSASGAKDQVARLLTLVPFLHARGRSPRRGRRAPSASRPSSWSRTSSVLFMCGLPGGYPDDLIDVDLDALEDRRGTRLDGRDPGHQRRLPRPAAAADPDRGDRDDRRAARAARRRGGDTREVVDRTLAKLEAAAAGGAALVDAGGGRRWPTTGRLRAVSGARRSRPAAGPADLLRARPRRGVRARRRPARGGHRAAASPTSTPGATAPRRPGCSGSTGSARPRSSTAEVVDRAEAAARPRPTGCSSAARRPRLVDPAARPAGPLGRRVLPRRGRPAWARTAPRGRPARRRRRWLQRLLLRLAPHAHVVSPPPGRRLHARLAQRDTQPVRARHLTCGVDSAPNPTDVRNSSMLPHDRGPGRR